jgi:hypothetical protein
MWVRLTQAFKALPDRGGFKKSGAACRRPIRRHGLKAIS